MVVRLTPFNDSSLQQHPRFHQIASVEPVIKPPKDFRQERERLLSIAPLSRQACEAHSRAQLEELRSLPTGHIKTSSQTRFRLVTVLLAEADPQLTLQPEDLGFVIALARCLNDRECFIQSGKALFDLAVLGAAHAKKGKTMRIIQAGSYASIGSRPVSCLNDSPLQCVLVVGQAGFLYDSSAPHHVSHVQPKHELMFLGHCHQGTSVLLGGYTIPA